MHTLKIKGFLLGILSLLPVHMTLIHAQEFPVVTNSVGIRMVNIQAGDFQMGNPDPAIDAWDETPVHAVTIRQDFFISETEVTLEQYRLFKPSFSGASDDGFVTGVSWYDAVAFCEWLGQKEGKPYRLPTEAEWEYAARAGTSGPFWSGEEPADPGLSNPWGLKNIHSGVSEWCMDWYGPYPSEHQNDPVGVEESGVKVIRGGGLDENNVHYARSMNRAGHAPAFRRVQEPEKISDFSGKKVSDQPTEEGLVGLFYGSADLQRVHELEILTSFNQQWIGDRDRGNEWSAEWKGTLVAPADGPIDFQVTSDYGVTLKIGGQYIVRWRDEEDSVAGGMEMKSGKEYPIHIIYNHIGGEKSYMTIQWRWGETPFSNIPNAYYRHSPLLKSRFEKKTREVIGPSSVGFRVVQAPLPESAAIKLERPFIRQCIVMDQHMVKQGPDPDTPWYRRRPLLPMPPDNIPRDQIRLAGLHPGIMNHNHSPALEVCPNGDVMMIIYTSEHEYEPEVPLMATRLRYGAETWDMPEIFFNLPDVNDHAPCLYTEKDKMMLFWGNPRLEDASPFQWMTSKDNGATWSEVQFPKFITKIGLHSKQPINTVFRAQDSTLYVSSDAKGGTSVLWGTTDYGKTWFDTGGRTGGRHTSFAELKNGKILGMGGKNTSIEGYMPKSISDDGGRTWEVTGTPFSEQGSNQRPCLIRLQSGRLFFCGDLQHRSGRHPKAITERGSYVALSEDKGKSWDIKKLIGTLPHETDKLHDTIGYSVARQAPNGIIHLITTMNTPCLHFELNEAWILSEKADWVDTKDSPVRKVREYRERYSSGTLKAVRKGGITPSGQFILHGEQKWYYPNGHKQWIVTFKSGQKQGKEFYRDSEGRLVWEWDHKKDGSSLWTQFWPNGRKKSQSAWKDFRLWGEAKRWDREGKLISHAVFTDGFLDRQWKP